MAGWINQRMSNAISIWANGGYFDIPNGWVTDSCGIVFAHMEAINGAGDLDSELVVNGLIESGHHAGKAGSWGASSLVGAGATVSFTLGKGGLHYFKFRRMH
ncbi:hypothetical protein HVK93_003453 [Escherichia coli]|uniref:hypothetical protein n=1 Tax=Escherichia coli TaxID=562 RepID=UPI000BB962A0|nr:hypothetical protein [Escherichia coli]EFO2023322.1 hypothetical protein [Escherichia coli]EFO4098868.1 hypothetical protein [Escherichia coli]EFT1901101.1 hypothetical protein [Escherichia coli]EGJ7461895.1 hypothetical protein [Escherichia coli]EGO8751253.1 hypothetical protein [Escherichia coli]